MRNIPRWLNYIPYSKEAFELTKFNTGVLVNKSFEVRLLNDIYVVVIKECKHGYILPLATLTFEELDSIVNYLLSLYE